MQNLIQPNTWLIEEVERKRMTTNQPNGSLMTSQQHILLNQNYIDQQKQQRLRRSYPSLLSDNNNIFDPNNMKSSTGYIYTPLSNILLKYILKSIKSRPMNYSNNSVITTIIAILKPLK